MSSPTKTATKTVAKRTERKRTGAHGATTYYAHTDPGKPPARLAAKPTGKPSADTGGGTEGTGSGSGRVTGAAASLTPSLGIDSTLGARRTLALELIVGSAIILASPDARSTSSPYSDALRQEAYFLGVMLVLAVVSMGGRQTARFAAGVGALTVLALAVRGYAAKAILTGGGFTTSGKNTGGPAAAISPASPDQKG